MQEENQNLWKKCNKAEEKTVISVVFDVNMNTDFTIWKRER